MGNGLHAGNSGGLRLIIKAGSNAISWLEPYFSVDRFERFCDDESLAQILHGGECDMLEPCRLTGR